MITGAHFLSYSTDADADRTFMRDVLGWHNVDVGGGWLIFRTPPAELAVHPADTPSLELYLMCDDLAAEMERLQQQGVEFSEVKHERWGDATSFKLPSGASMGLYQPKHPTAI